MTKGNPQWERFEREVQKLLNLRSTPGSGNQWHDISDGVSRPEDPYKIMVDCKYTQGKSYSLDGNTMNTWANNAAMMGYGFALPIRLDGARGERNDWVTISLGDYAHLVENYRAQNQFRRCGAAAPIASTAVCCRRMGHSDRHDNGDLEWTP